MITPSPYFRDVIYDWSLTITWNFFKNKTYFFFKLREFAYELHQKMEGGASESEIDLTIQEQMKTI